MTFHIGQKVVCVNARGYEEYLTQNAVYIVRPSPHFSRHQD